MQEQLTSRRPRLRSRAWYLRTAPAHSWIHGGWFNRRDPARTIYFLCTPYGPITLNEEYFLWVYAATGRYRLSKRMAYGRQDTNVMSEKLTQRLKVLLEEHEKGQIDLSKGPWVHYGFQIGDPTMFSNRNVKDYTDVCLAK